MQNIDDQPKYNHSMIYHFFSQKLVKQIKPKLVANKAQRQFDEIDASHCEKPGIYIKYQ